MKRSKMTSVSFWGTAIFGTLAATWFFFCVWVFSLIIRALLKYIGN